MSAGLLSLGSAFGFRDQLSPRLQPIMPRVAWQTFAHPPFSNEIGAEPNFIIGNGDRLF
ncbi:MAG TPA: hypothetical protein VGI60_05515 [Chthoniobacterales bacterium]